MERNIHLQTYSEDILRYPAKNKFTESYETMQKVSGEAVGWDGLKKNLSHVCKVLSICETAEENFKIIRAVEENFAGKVDVTKSAPIFAEIVSPGVSKASATKILAKKFGIDKSEIAAIGDADNDLPMLLSAGTSIAMGNATDEVKKSCTVTTSNCEDDGFAEAVYKYVLK